MCKTLKCYQTQETALTRSRTSPGDRHSLDPAPPPKDCTQSHPPHLCDAIPAPLNSANNFTLHPTISENQYAIEACCRNWHRISGFPHCTSMNRDQGKQMYLKHPSQEFLINGTFRQLRNKSSHKPTGVRPPRCGLCHQNLPP